jgi:hypothetical protein
VKVAVIRTIKHIQAIKDVLAGMRVNNVQENSDAHAMSGID